MSNDSESAPDRGMDEALIELQDQIWRLTIDTRKHTPESLRKWVLAETGKDLESLTIKDCRRLLEKLL